MIDAAWFVSTHSSVSFLGKKLSRLCKILFFTSGSSGKSLPLMLSVNAKGFFTEPILSLYEFKTNKRETNQNIQLQIRSVPDNVVNSIFPEIDPTNAMVAAIDEGASVCITLLSLSVFSLLISLSS